jgi:hypothetical protein
LSIPQDALALGRCRASRLTTTVPRHERLNPFLIKASNQVSDRII